MFRLFRLSRSSFSGFLAAVLWMPTFGSHAALHMRDITGAPTTDGPSAEFAYDDRLDATWYLKPLSPGLGCVPGSGVSPEGSCEVPLGSP